MVEKMPVPSARFTYVYVDLVGPLPASQGGHTHLFTMVDRSTRWPEAVPLKPTTAEAVVDAYMATWVARFGLLAVQRGRKSGDPCV